MITALIVDHHRQSSTINSVRKKGQRYDLAICSTIQDRTPIISINVTTCTHQDHQGPEPDDGPPYVRHEK